MVLRRLLVLLVPAAMVGQVVTPSGVPLLVDTLLGGLHQPSAMVLLPGGEALLADRAMGRVYRLSRWRSGGGEAGGPDAPALGGLPPVLTGEDAGIHDLVLHPDFARNGWVYLSYSLGDSTRSTLAVDRLTLDGNRFTDRVTILVADAWSDERFHYGGRLAFADSLLFVTVGDRHRRAWAQDLQRHAGKVLRLDAKGQAPPDNPFVGTDTAHAEIWSYGHRNPQGLAWDRETRRLWADEHGPRHGDELNLIQSGSDYGWPRVSWGWEYEGGPIGQGLPVDAHAVMPLWVWTPAIAPSGLTVYRGAMFPEWNGSLLLGGMSARRSLERLVLDGRTVVLEERILLGRLGRVRFVVVDLDGALVIGNDDGVLVRLSRAE